MGYPVGFARRLASPLTEAIRRRHRRTTVRTYLAPRRKQARDWVPRHTEAANFYYRLTEHNIADLAHSVAIITGAPVEHVHHLLAEVERDDALLAHIQDALTTEATTRDSAAALGRRIGWYAFVRVLRPRLVIETGVHDGVGACVLTRALMLNAEEGFPGRYLGTDIDPAAGRLLTGRYADFGTVRIGDSLATLRTLDEPVDIFINDSDHSATYEASEYEVIAPLLSGASLVIGDNSHATSSLRDFAERAQRPFLFFAEEPLDHWYPGAGIGMSPTRMGLAGTAASVSP